MKVYHFVPAQYGLENIRRRRLKIATIPDLNDPFELLCVDLSDHDLRKRMLKWKDEMGKSFGLVCFSRTWRNPVQWSHYADRHRGLALGFELSNEFAIPVTYDKLRSKAEAHELLGGQPLSGATVRKFISTKFAHWRYEQEVRGFLALDERDEESGLYFYGFSKEMKLVEVIIGAESEIRRDEVRSALGDLSLSTSIRNARLAFKEYGVTTQNDSSLWA